MSVTSTAAYLGRRAAQKERVRILYRRALRDTLNFRHLFSDDTSNLRESFEVNKHVVYTFPFLHFPLKILILTDKLIADAEATYNKWRHPDPYIAPWASGGSKFTHNPTPPPGIEIIYNYGREDND